MKNIKIPPKTWAIALGIVWLMLLGGYFVVQKNFEKEIKLVPPASPVVVVSPELASMER